MSEESSDKFVPVSPTDPNHETPTPAPVPHTEGSTSGMAIAGLVCAFIFPLLGLIFSIIGLNQTKDNKRGGRVLAIIGLVVSILGLLAGLFWTVVFIIAASSSTNDLNDYSYDASSSSLMSSNDVVNKGAVGDTVDAESMKLTVSEVTPNFIPESDFYTPEAGKEYIVVSISLRNAGSDTESFSSFDFKVRDSSGTEKSDAFVGGVTGELTGGSLAPGGTTSGVLVFEVPVGDEGLVLIYEPSIFGNEKAEISL